MDAATRWSDRMTLKFKVQAQTELTSFA